MTALTRLLPLKSWLILASALVLLLSLGFCAVQERRLSAARLEAAAAKAQAHIIAQEREARDRAAAQRLTDAKTNAAREKERSDATASIPDARPSARRLARACVQLRQQGTVDLPPECRP